jgi:eukaryotic-like serine/threonine-protein kinase
MNGDGSGLAQMTTGIARAPSCSPDSQQVFFTLAGMAQYSQSEAGVWMMPIAGGTPKQVLPPSVYNSADISQDATLAGYLHIESGNNYNYSIRVAELATGRQLYQVPLDRSDLNVGHLSPDDKALVATVLRNGGHSLLYQPLDGSPTHQFVDPMSETITDFRWSPSGKQLALLRVKSSSDVVLITDQAAKAR